MLLLERHKDEDITLRTTDGVITVRVCRVLDGRVTLGIDAPRCVAIQRDDIKNLLPGRTAQPALAGAAPSVPITASGRS